MKTKNDSNTTDNTDHNPNQSPSKEHEDSITISLDDITRDLIQVLKDTNNEKILHIGDFTPHTNDTKTETTKKKKTVADIRFNLKPKDVKQHLDRYVIKQDEAKKTLAISICDHLNYIKAAQQNPNRSYQKQNILMMGPTGVGKTYMIKCIADLIGVPFVKSDATKFTETGYQGGDVEDLVRQLITKADNDTELAQYGIIYLDEIDKIAASSQQQNKDVSGRGVQANLLKLMEDTEVPIRPAWDMPAQMKAMMSGNKDSNETIQTNYILFIGSGAFVGLDDITRNRLEGSKYGFEKHKNNIDPKTMLQECGTSDLIKFGLEPEFVGRLPVRVSCNELDSNDLYHILVESEESILNHYTNSFYYYGIHVLFEESALKQLAEMAIQEKTGARGLGTIFERIFRDYKFELPSSTVTHFVVSNEMLENPKSYLKQLVEDPKKSDSYYFELLFKQLEARLKKKYKLTIKIDPRLRDEWVHDYQTIQIDIQKRCDAIFQPLTFKLKEVQKNIQKNILKITKTFVKNPEQSLDKWASKNSTYSHNDE